ncbi:MAG: class II aldolase/adducin family protein [Planctomycetes bacterium]|nr:class II aldolase/adducin family protein [Planctomycetota bacterium]
MVDTNPEVILHDKKASDSDEKTRIVELADTAQAREEKVKLAAAYRMLARQGLDDGVAGHISLRVPGAPEYFWVNPFGMLFSEVTAANLVLVNAKGEIVDGGGMINFAGFCIHSAIHQARPNVNCAVHTHPPAGSAYSTLHMLLEPLDQTGCSFFDDHALYNEYTGVVLDADQTQGIVEALGEKRALILANHGLLTCAETVEQALIDMIDMERTCRVNMDAMSTGRPVHAATPEVALHSRAVLTQPGRYPFQWAAMLRDLNRHETDYDSWRSAE